MFDYVLVANSFLARLKKMMSSRFQVANLRSEFKITSLSTMTTSNPALRENDPYFDHDSLSGSSNDRDIFLVLSEEEKKRYYGPAFCVGCATCCLTHSCAAGCLAGILVAPLLRSCWTNKRSCCTKKQEGIRARLIDGNNTIRARLIDGNNTTNTRSSPGTSTTQATTPRLSTMASAPADPIEATAVEPLIYADYYQSSSSPPVMATASFVDFITGAEKTTADNDAPSAAADNVPPSAPVEDERPPAYAPR